MNIQNGPGTVPSSGNYRPQFVLITIAVMFILLLSDLPNKRGGQVRLQLDLDW